ncbi:MAG TPA: Gfo/Idh/MocA family oxidoreductase, partial [Chloroflexota bacterium]|nr:Gfo/Idh/MocA family oxidoreductase [Chloroflexota bacterium]
MSKTYRMGVIGFAHMHINELMRVFKGLPGVEWVACADTKPALPEKVEARFTRGWNMKHQALQEIGIPKGYDDYREMLDKEKLDLVLFCPENARHAEVAEAIAGHGAHMLTEKPMADSMKNATRMATAARNAGVSLVINWPSAWSPAVRTMHRLVREGAIGTLWQFKNRYGSRGPLSHGSTHPGVDGRAVEMSEPEKGATWWHQAGTGGGALLDYCCYGAALSRWFVGEPATAAFGMKANLQTPYGDADDNAVIAVRFPKVMAILEATWSTIDHAVPVGPIAYGSTGTILTERRGESTVVVIRRGAGKEAEVIEADALPAGRETLGKEVLNHLTTGEPLWDMLDL